MKHTAYGYLRVSSKGQIDGHGLDRQLDVIQGYAQTADIGIVKVYREEGVSGTADETDRPSFQEMIADILRNGTRMVIVEGMDRLAREYRIQETLLIYLASKGITLLSARTGENVTEAVNADPMKKALVQIQGVFSELEKNMLVKKLRSAREKVRQERGKCEGRKGYRELAPDTLKAIQQLRRKPRNGKRRTYRQTANMLNEKGYRTCDGKAFNTGNLRQMLYRMK